MRRRRAIQLMNYFDAYQSGRTLLMDRLALLEQLVPLEASAEFAVEQAPSATSDRIAGGSSVARGRALLLSLRSNRRCPNGSVLPDGVQLERGALRVEFSDVQDLLRKLYAVCQEAAGDFEAFRAAAEGHFSATPSGSSWRPARQQIRMV